MIISRLDVLTIVRWDDIIILARGGEQRAKALIKQNKEKDEVRKTWVS